MYITGAWGVAWAVQGLGFWRLGPLGSAWDPHGLWDSTAQRISIAARKGRLGSCPELHSQQPGHWAIAPPVLWTETPLPPPPSPHGVQSVGLGIGLPLSVILICKTTGGDAARIPNVTCGLTTLVMHDPHPQSFPSLRHPLFQVSLAWRYGGGPCQDLGRG